MSAYDKKMSDSIQRARQAIKENGFPSQLGLQEYTSMSSVVLGPWAQDVYSVSDHSEVLLYGEINRGGWLNNANRIAGDDLLQYFVWERHDFDVLRRLRYGLRHMQNPWWWRDSEFYGRSMVADCVWFVANAKVEEQGVMIAGELDLAFLGTGRVRYFDLVFGVESGIGSEPMFFRYESVDVLRDGGYLNRFVQGIAPYVVSKIWSEDRA